MITVERVDFVSVPTRETAQARRFYSELLRIPESTTPEDVYAEFEASNVTLGTWEPERDGVPFSPGMTIAIRVPDVDAARRELEAAGVQFHGETLDTGVCHMAFCSDFDGNGVILHRRYAEPRPHGIGHQEARERENARRVGAAQ